MYSAYFYIMCMKSSNHKEEHRSPQHLPCTTTKLYIALNRISFWCILYTTDVQTVHQTEYSYSFVVSIILYSYFTLFILLFSFLSVIYIYVFGLNWFFYHYKILLFKLKFTIFNLLSNTQIFNFFPLLIFFYFLNF